MDGMTFFDGWLGQAEESERDPLSREAAVPYQSIWKRWMLHLQGHVNADGAPVASVHWTEARAQHVHRFLDASKTQGKSRGAYADVTQRRYWRVLDRAYAYALKEGRVSANPARAIGEHGRPPPENHLGTILQPRLWDAARRQIPDGNGVRATEMRDRAMLLILFDHALMPQELRGLMIEDLLSGTNDGVIDAVQLDGPGPRQRRKIVLSQEAGEALNAWLGLRNLVLAGHTDGPVFCKTNGEPLTHDAVHKQVTKTIEQALQVCGEEHRPPRIGPQIVRNTGLVRWMNAGIPPDQVAVWAGLKNVKGLYRLREAVNPEIRTVLNESVSGY